MRIAFLFLGGAAAAVAGVLLRTCGDGFPPEFAAAWCGHGTQALIVTADQHCAGCALMASGVAALATGAILAALRSLRSQPMGRT